MNAHSAPLIAHTTSSMHRVRRAVGLVVALILASLAFGVGLPWIIVDAPLEAETLWAREIQTVVAPAAVPVTIPTTTRRTASGRSLH